MNACRKMRQVKIMKGNNKREGGTNMRGTAFANTPSAVKTEARRVVKLGPALQASIAGRRRCREKELVPLLLAHKRMKVVQIVYR